MTEGSRDHVLPSTDSGPPFHPSRLPSCPLGANALFCLKNLIDNRDELHLHILAKISSVPRKWRPLSFSLSHGQMPFFLFICYQGRWKYNLIVKIRKISSLPTPPPFLKCDLYMKWNFPLRQVRPQAYQRENLCSSNVTVRRVLKMVSHQQRTSLYLCCHTVSSYTVFFRVNFYQNIQLSFHENNREWHVEIFSDWVYGMGVGGYMEWLSVDSLNLAISSLMNSMMKLQPDFPPVQAEMSTVELIRKVAFLSC